MSAAVAAPVCPAEPDALALGAQPAANGSSVAVLPTPTLPAARHPPDAEPGLLAEAREASTPVVNASAEAPAAQAKAVTSTRASDVTAEVTVEEASREANIRITARVLESAIVGKDVSVLTPAIDWAIKMGLPAARILAAQTRRNELETAASLKLAQSAAERALENTPDDAGKLAIAIRKAAAVGVTGSAVQRARKRKLASSEDRQQARERAEAADALGMATTGADLEALDSALAWAESAGVEVSILAPARRRRGALEARTELAAALAAADLEALAAAIQKAEAASLDAETLAPARSKLRALELEAERKREQEELRRVAEKALESALEVAEGDIAGLDAAIGRAVYAGVDISAIGRARCRLVELREARQRKEIAEAEGELETALSAFANEDSDLAKADLRAAIARARRAGGGAAVKSAAAAQRLVAAEEAAAEAALTSAIAWGGAEALASAIQRAKLAGASERKLKEAYDRMTQLQNMEDQMSSLTAANSLEAAIAGTDAGELRSAVTLSMRVGVGMEVLWRAQKRMNVLEEACQSRLLHDAATAAIQEELGGSDRARLILALHRGEELGADEAVMGLARDRLVRML